MMNSSDQHHSELIKIISGGEPSGTWQPVLGSAATGLTRYLENEGDIPESETRRVVKEGHEILSNCIPPSVEAGRRIGLVCGYVQSGKTLSMTAVSALAKDNGFCIVILLAGVTTLLVGQSKKRLEEHLRGGAGGYDWLMIENPTRKQDRPLLESLVHEWRSTSTSPLDRRVLFVTVLKHHSRLANLADAFDGLSLHGVPTIIFDDEADQASMNTKPHENEPSSTHRHIEGVRSKFPVHTFLQYTATPQAPLLISRIDSLSADFAELVSPGSDYVGGKVFFDARDTDLVRDIPFTDLFRDDDIPNAAPRSLLEAMSIFYVGVAAGLISGGTKHRSMLIHPSMKTDVHQIHYQWANEIQRDWYQTLSSESDPDRDQLVAQFKDAHQNLAETVDDIAEYSEIEPLLPKALNRTIVTRVNSREGREINWENAYSHILVGGEKLGRGYTVNGLTVTYMSRSPGGWTADTIQQRARFFGYCSNYIGYCRLYLHPDVHKSYRAYVIHEEVMRAHLAQHRGKPLKDWKRIFYLDRKMKATRHNILKTPYLRAKLKQGWYWPRAPYLARPAQQQSTRMISALREAMEFKACEQDPRHLVARGVSLQSVYTNLLVLLAYPEERDAVNLCAINCQISLMLEKSPETACTIYLMDNGKSRRRELRHGLIPQLFQGRSSAEDADRYPGDRTFLEEDKVTIQVHNLSVIDSENDEKYEDVFTVAVHLPISPDVIVQPEEA